MLNFKKKPSYTAELIAGKDNDEGFSIDEIKCFKDGEYTHSVKVLCFPKNIIKELEEINGRKSISQKS